MVASPPLFYPLPLAHKMLQQHNRAAAFTSGSSRPRSSRAAARTVDAGAAAQRRGGRVVVAVRAAASQAYTNLQGVSVQRADTGEPVELLSLWQVRRGRWGLWSIGGCSPGAWSGLMAAARHCWSPWHNLPSFCFAAVASSSSSRNSSSSSGGSAHPGAAQRQTLSLDNPITPPMRDQGVPGQRVVVPFLTHFGDLTSWEFAQKLQRKALQPLKDSGVKVRLVGWWVGWLAVSVLAACEASRLHVERAVVGSSCVMGGRQPCRGHQRHM